MEHNFMMSPAGRENFFNKWHQVVGSIQKTNDLDVHIALLSAPSYAAEIKNKYYSKTKTPHQIIREHVEMFGFMQKNVNALDILIEEAKITLQTWGSQPPNFMLCNSKLTMQVCVSNPSLPGDYDRGSVVSCSLIIWRHAGASTPVPRCDHGV